MAYRFDMQGKTQQQQIIVAKRDAEDKIRKEEYVKSRQVESVKIKTRVLAVDKDNCPNQDNIINKNQCQNCKYFLSFISEDVNECVNCSCYN